MENKEQQLSEKQSITSRHETQSPNSVRECSEPIIVDDLLIEILSRLPEKSVDRFRCVSKSWESMLRGPYFTKLFLNRSSTTRPRLFFAVATAEKFFFFSSPQPQNPDENSCLVATPYHISYPKYLPYHTDCTSVCGLVFLQGWRTKAKVICNPATGKFITLPKVLLKPKNLPKVKPESNPTKVAEMYLGYDPVTKQFKVLCMTTSSDERPNTHQVLTLEPRRRAWRAIEGCKFYFEGYSVFKGQVCMNGVLYFGDESNGSSVIVCFDVRSEKFSFINTDKGMSLDRSLTLFNYNGNLAAHEDYTSQYGKIVLWVLEDAATHKWAKHVYVLPSWAVARYRFVGMTATGEIVWSPYHLKRSFHVALYNLERKISTSVEIQGFEKFDHHHLPSIKTFLDYVENMNVM